MLPSSPFSSSFFPAAFRHRQNPRPCHYSFSGLRSVAAQGYDPRDLTVFAHFFVDPESKVEREASPLELEASTGNDRATAAVAYPSIREIWPEVYTTAHIRAVEVRSLVHVGKQSVCLSSDAYPLCTTPGQIWGDFPSSVASLRSTGSVDDSDMCLPYTFVLLLLLVLFRCDAFLIYFHPPIPHGGKAVLRTRPLPSSCLMLPNQMSEPVLRSNTRSPLSG